MEQSQLKQIFGQTPDALTILALVLLFCSATPYFKGGNIIFDTLSNFTFQYAVAALFLMAIAFLLQMNNAIMPLFLAFILCMLQLAPLLVYTSPEAASGSPIRVLQANVLKTNTNTEKLKTLIMDENPDIVVLAETTTTHDKMFDELLKTYPYQRIAYRDDNSSFGMAILSRLPMENSEEIFFDNKDIPALLMSVTLNGRKVDILSLHPMNPLVDITSRNNEFKKFAETYKDRQSKNIIVAGDMNATPYSGLFRHIMKDAGLKSARKGHGIMGTYPASLPTSLLRLPIDHVFVTSSMVVQNYRIGADIGSDHLPTIADIALRK